MMNRFKTSRTAKARIVFVGGGFGGLFTTLGLKGVGEVTLISGKDHFSYTPLLYEYLIGKFVEFHGEGAATLSAPDRATIGNMAPEYGATIGYFPVDEKACEYLLATGRSEEYVKTFRSYFEAQALFGIPHRGDIDYTTVLELDLVEIETSVSGPRRPQDRVNLSKLGDQFTELLRKPVGEGGYGKSQDEIGRRYRTTTSDGKEGLEPPLAGGGEQAAETVPPGIGHTSVRNTRMDRDRDDEQPPDAQPHRGDAAHTENIGSPSE